MPPIFPNLNFKNKDRGCVSPFQVRKDLFQHLPPSVRSSVSPQEKSKSPLKKSSQDRARRHIYIYEILLLYGDDNYKDNDKDKNKDSRNSVLFLIFL